MAFDRYAHKLAWNNERGRRTTALIHRWKQRKGCACCGYNKDGRGLVLDHLIPSDKDRNKRSKAYNPLWSKKRLKQELAKCQVLCGTCHLIRTAEEKHFLLRFTGSTGISTGVNEK